MNEKTRFAALSLKGTDPFAVRDLSIGTSRVSRKTDILKRKKRVENQLG